MQGELSGFDAYHKRSKVCYDDGQEEWVSLMRETFRCCLPDLLQGTPYACVECAGLGTISCKPSAACPLQQAVL